MENYCNLPTCVSVFSLFHIMLFNLQQQILLYHEDSESKQLHMQSKGIHRKINIWHPCNSLSAPCSIAFIHYTLRSLLDSPLSLEIHFFFLLWLPHNFFALYFYRCLLAINTNEISLLNSILLVHLQLWPNFPTRETDWTFHYLMDGSKHSYRTGLTISIIIEFTA